MCELLERGQQAFDRVRVTNWIARDDRDAGNDLVGEERTSVRAEEARLVRADNERRERIRSMLGDDHSYQLVLLLPGDGAITPRSKPTGSQAETARDTHPGDRPG